MKQPNNKPEDAYIVKKPRPIKQTVKIVSGRNGWHLKINGQFIKQHFDGEIKAILSEFSSVPCGATEWASIKDIRNFWASYRILAIHATKNPHVSIWGDLQKVN